MKELRSDNASNFVGADRKIKRENGDIDDKKVRSELIQRLQVGVPPSGSITHVWSMGETCEIREEESEGHYWQRSCQ